MFCVNVLKGLLLPFGLLGKRPLIFPPPALSQKAVLQLLSFVATDLILLVVYAVQTLPHFK